MAPTTIIMMMLSIPTMNVPPRVTTRRFLRSGKVRRCETGDQRWNSHTEQLLWLSLICAVQRIAVALQYKFRQTSADPSTAWEARMSTVVQLSPPRRAGPKALYEIGEIP